MNAMRNRSLIGIVVLSLCLVLEASAQFQRELPAGAGPYARVGLGPAFLEEGRLSHFDGPAGNKVDYEVGFAASAAFGYAFNNYIAADFEFGAVGAGIDSVPGYYSYDTFLNNVPFLANVTLSCPIPGTRVVPYLGAGAGGSVTVFSTDGFGDGSVAVYGDDTDVVFAWQAFAGARVELNRRMSVGIGYKYFGTGDSSFRYPPFFPGSEPDLVLGFDGIRAHSVIFSFQMKF
jgi:opacity protein-like surface antigen